MSYNTVFGNNTVTPSTVSYAAYTLPNNTAFPLNWPTSYVDNNNPVAGINDIFANANGANITLPDATLISVGYGFQFNNKGSFQLTINNFASGFILNIPVGNSFEMYLIDNTIPAGNWGFIQNGAVPAVPTASALAGNGLDAIGGLLNTNYAGTSINANYQVQTTDRANILVWNGGAGTVTMLNPWVAGFYISFNNEGTGQLTFNTGDGTTIDGGSTFVIQPKQSVTFIAVNVGGVGNQWSSLGFGTPNETVTTVNNLNVAAGGNFTLTSAQANATIQNYTGALAANAVVIFPAIPGQWYINNTATNAFTVSVELNGVGSPLVIPNGYSVIVYSDGTGMFTTPTVQIASLFGDGTVGAPGIAFSSQPTTGFYLISPSVVGYSGNNNLSITFGSTGLGIRNGNALVLGNTGGLGSAFVSSNAMSNNISYTLPAANGSGYQALITNGASPTTSQLSFTAGGIYLQREGGNITNTGNGTGTFNPTLVPTTAGGNIVDTNVITPTANGNTYIVDISIVVSSNVGGTITVALFSSVHGANAIAATCQTCVANQVETINLKYVGAFTSGAIQTFSLYIGGAAAGTTYFNSTLASALFGGVCNSYFTITEYSQ